MRWFRRLVFFLVVTLILAVVGSLIYLTSQKPQYSGILQLKGMKQQCEVIFDFYGVPHIYAASEEDAYTALGYVHAQDRLFQMEMVRRVASGRLAEILGQDFIKVDVFFKTLGFDEHARESANLYMNADSLPYQKAARAYLNGVNEFIRKGQVPVEFRLLGIPPEEYSVSDLYLSTEFMAFNFSMAFRTDPLMSFIASKLGSKYLASLQTGLPPGSYRVPVNQPPADSSTLKTAYSTRNLLDMIPVAIPTGSNAWVVAPQRSKSGKVLLGNDTHIGYAQPSVWYEAHLEYPGHSFYGNYLAGMPFAALGHSRIHGWGLTMLENDDLDFYSERLKPGDSTQYWAGGKWMPLKQTRKTIKVKDEDDVIITVMESRHGPLMHRAMPEWADVTGQPVSAWWTHLRFPNNLMQVTYSLNHAGNMDDFQYQVSQVISPGLNVLYGDKTGNIAWWTAARLMKRADRVNPVLLQDGTDFKNDPSGYTDFFNNPSSINPAEGILFSANAQPDSVPGEPLMPGYFVPEDRSLRLLDLFREKNIYAAEDLQRIVLDAVSPVTPQVSSVIFDAIRKDLTQRSPAHHQASRVLLMWNGDHQMRDVAPTIYYKLVYYILRYAMMDELGEERFKTYLTTHVMKTSLIHFLRNDSSVWWNDIQTAEVVESRNMIFEKAYEQTISDLVNQMGSNTDTWEWGRVHVLEHQHPIGQKKPFNLLFNVGPYPVPGGPEVVNQSGFDLCPDGIYRVKYGPAMRRVIDFADVENSKSILPTGQSGNVMSRYYYDQAIMYNTGKFRKQKMNRAEIEANRSGKIIFEPIRK